MAVCGTTSYVYFTDRSLGAGATGNVYFGRHKRRGDPCAIKVFRSSDGGNKELQLREREFSVTSKLNHENIVKFIAIEKHSHGPDKVLIMELCTGGSVYNMLEEPENAYGFPEDEFLIFLNDITKALRYLRQNGIVHRDIKPGNILRCIKDDLSSLYKLTDFGAARELPEDGEFMSLCGTEEYLHPDVYERALIGVNRFDRFSKPFNASVDLWSLGVTLYHVASGSLPFQPYGGRKNKEAMHMIISKKEPGVISGVQLTRDGAIEWSRELPKTCRLSTGIKKLLVPVLIGLLESERKRQWSFEKFFYASNDIVSRTLLHIFCVSSCSYNRLYLSQEERKSFTHFQECLADLTKLPAAHQLLFHERWPVESIVLDSDRILNKIQKTSAECPLFVMPTTYISTEWQMEAYDLPKLPVMPSVVSISEDAAFARNTCAYAMFLHYKTSQLCCAQNSLAICASHLGTLLYTSMQEQHFLQQGLAPLYEKLLKLNSFRITQLNQFDTEWKFLKENHERADTMLTNLNQNITSQSSSVAEFLKSFCAKACQPISCVKKQAHLVKELEAIKNNFKEQKKKEKDLSHNELQIHKFDRGRASEGAKNSMELFSTHCSVNMIDTWQIFKAFHSCYSERRSEIDQLGNLLRGLHDQIVNIDDCIVNALLRNITRDRKKCSEEADEKEENGKLDQPLWSHTGNDSAIGTDFQTGVMATRFSECFMDACELKETHPVYQITAEIIPEEVSMDSGIEVLAEMLKKTLKDNSKRLKTTVTTSYETGSLVNTLTNDLTALDLLR